MSSPFQHCLISIALCLLEAVAYQQVWADETRQLRVANPVFEQNLADPSVVVFEQRFYLYATKDPWGGEDLACLSTADFVSWETHKLNWPTRAACQSNTGNSNKVWAPSVVRAADGRFFMYVSVGSEVYCGVAAHPTGPWKNVRDDQGPLLRNGQFDETHTIDAEAFLDTDGKAYLFWGSGWNWVNGHCWAAELAPDMVTFVGEPKDITPPGYFEAPFMLKRGDNYYLMYSDGKTIEDTYKVRYSVAKHPLGPFETEGKNSPILVSDHAREILGPGHHCVFSLGGQDFIAYHRHRRPFDAKTIKRQICFDVLKFEPDGSFSKVIPTDTGVVLEIPWQ